MPKRNFFKHVPAEFPEQLPCKILFITEAPGDDETISGRPLNPTAPAGRLFERLLRAAGLERSEVAITNVFDQQLPDNDVVNICGTTKEAKTWEDYDLPSIMRGKYILPEWTWHLERLEREIAHCQPTLIVPLGATAIWALTGKTGVVKSVRGTVALDKAGRKILATGHPAAILHGDDSLYPLMVMDFQKAVREAEFPEIRLPHRQFVLEPTLKDIETYKRVLLREAKILSVDIETSPKFRLITAIGFAHRKDFGFVVPLCDARKPNGSYWATLEDELKARQLCAEILASDIPKLGQNFGGYDWRWLYDAGMPTRNYLHDTRLQHHALYPELPKDLGTLGSVYCNEAAWKLMRKGPKKQVKREE